MANVIQIQPFDIKNEFQDTALDLTSQSSNSSSQSSQSSVPSPSPSSTGDSKSHSAKIARKRYRSSNSTSNSSSSGSNKDSDDYRRRRERNNEAVKKSRQRSKLKTEETVERISRLDKVNEAMQQDLDILVKEVRLLSSMYASHMQHAHNVTVDETKLISADGKVYVEVDPVQRK